MGTLADLQARIITETNRADLGDVLASALQQAISDSVTDYENERFWFNELRVLTTVQNAQEYTSLPSGYQVIDKLFIVVGGVRFELQKRSMDELERFYTVPQIGQPMVWCMYQETARVWPTPNMDYPGIWLTISDVTPALDFTQPAAITNSWTTDAAWLICAASKVKLYRNIFRDPDGEQAALRDLDEAYTNLKGVSDRQLSSGRMKTSW